MKKALLLAALLLAASNAFAANSGTAITFPSAGGDEIFGTATATNPLVKLSTGVKGAAALATTGYAIETKHNSGSKIFGTANDSTSIYWQAVATTAAITNPGSAAAAAFSSGWTTY